MARAFGRGDRVGGFVGRLLLVLPVLLLVGAAGCSSRMGCQKPEPADAFSGKIESLLAGVEGSGFPGNLDAWSERRGDIQANFARILELSESDVPRRTAAVQALIVAEAISTSADEARTLGTGLERGEVRAWARRVLRGYASMGIRNQDQKAVDAEFISGLQQAWEDVEGHPQRNLPLYQEKATTLRGLARFHASPSCGESR